MLPPAHSAVEMRQESGKIKSKHGKAFKDYETFPIPDQNFMREEGERKEGERKEKNILPTSQKKPKPNNNQANRTARLVREFIHVGCGQLRFRRWVWSVQLRNLNPTLHPLLLAATSITLG